MDKRIYLIRQLVGDEQAECQFYKRGDGSLRHMLFRLRSPQSDREDLELLAVVDTEIQEDRQIPTDSIKSLTLPTRDVIIPSVGNVLSVRDLQRLGDKRWRKFHAALTQARRDPRDGLPLPSVAF